MAEMKRSDAAVVTTCRRWCSLCSAPWQRGRPSRSTWALRCAGLSVIRLDHNSLTGGIPVGFSLLPLQVRACTWL